MGEIFARCGYRCDLCAARSEDPEIRQKLVDGWKKYLNLQMYDVDNVKCEGCYGETRADKTCPIRPCVIEKGIENCAYCDEYICDKLKPYLGSQKESYKRFPDISENDYNLCLRQFANIERLQEISKKIVKR